MRAVLPRRMGASASLPVARALPFRLNPSRRFTQQATSRSIDSSIPHLTPQLPKGPVFLHRPRHIRPQPGGPIGIARGATPTALQANINFVNSFKQLGTPTALRDGIAEFRTLTSSKALEANLRTYHALVATLTKRRLFNEAWDVTEEMLKYFRPTSMTYSVLINLSNLSGQTPKALSLYQEYLAQTDVKFEIGVFNSMLSAAEAAALHDTVWLVVDDFLSREVVPDSVTLSILIKASRKEPKGAEKAVTVLKHGWQPDALTLNSVLRMCCRMGDLENAEANMDRFRKLGLSPNDVTWNVIILSYGLYGGIEAMEAKYKEMLAGGRVAGTSTYNIRINVLGRQSMFAEAIATFEELKKNGLEPDGFTLLAVAHIHRRSGNTEKLEQAKKELEAYCKRTGFRVVSSKRRALFAASNKHEPDDDLKEELLRSS